MKGIGQIDKWFRNYLKLKFSTSKFCPQDAGRWTPDDLLENDRLGPKHIKFLGFSKKILFLVVMDENIESQN